jgi:hypothetical protein
MSARAGIGTPYPVCGAACAGLPFRSGYCLTRGGAAR